MPTHLPVVHLYSPVEVVGAGWATVEAAGAVEAAAGSVEAAVEAAGSVEAVVEAAGPVEAAAGAVEAVVEGAGAVETVAEAVGAVEAAVEGAGLFRQLRERPLLSIRHFPSIRADIYRTTAPSRTEFLPPKTLTVRAVTLITHTLYFSLRRAWWGETVKLPWRSLTPSGLCHEILESSYQQQNP